jgi:hypothetical protein
LRSETRKTFCAEDLTQTAEKGAAELRFPSAERAISKLQSGLSFRRDVHRAANFFRRGDVFPAREAQAALRRFRKGFASGLGFDGVVPIAEGSSFL